MSMAMFNNYMLVYQFTRHYLGKQRWGKPMVSRLDFFFYKMVNFQKGNQLKLRLKHETSHVK